MTLELIEQVADLRGRLKSLEAEWDDMRAQIRRGYQRMEKAHQRLEEARDDGTELVPLPVAPDPRQMDLPGFAHKWAELKRRQG